MVEITCYKMLFFCHFGHGGSHLYSSQTDCAAVAETTPLCVCGWVQRSEPQGGFLSWQKAQAEHPNMCVFMQAEAGAYCFIVAGTKERSRSSLTCVSQVFFGVVLLAALSSHNTVTFNVCWGNMLTKPINHSFSMHWCFRCKAKM